MVTTLLTALFNLPELERESTECYFSQKNVAAWKEVTALTEKNMDIFSLTFRATLNA